MIDLPRATDYLQQALLIAIEYDDKASLVETQWSLALVARLGAQSHLALHHAKEALATARQVGQPELVARSLNTLLYPNMRLRHWQATIACAEEALRYYEASGEQIMQAECLRLQAGPGADRTRWTWRLPWRKR